MPTIIRLRRQSTASGGDFSSPLKRYQESRRHVVVDDFDQEAIRRCIYQFYKVKEHSDTASSDDSDSDHDGGTSDEDPDCDSDNCVCSCED